MAKGKQTSPRVAKTASKILKGNYSKDAKTTAGSALSQTPKHKRGR